MYKHLIEKFLKLVEKRNSMGSFFACDCCGRLEILGVPVWES
jgi:hypothetical protein